MTVNACERDAHASRFATENAATPASRLLTRSVNGAPRRSIVTPSAQSNVPPNEIETTDGQSASRPIPSVPCNRTSTTQPRLALQPGTEYLVLDWCLDELFAFCSPVRRQISTHCDTNLCGWRCRNRRGLRARTCVAGDACGLMAANHDAPVPLLDPAVAARMAMIFVYPNAYNDHLTWGSILVLILTCGPGVFSLD